MSAFRSNKTGYAIALVLMSVTNAALAHHGRAGGEPVFDEAMRAHIMAAWEQTRGIVPQLATNPIVPTVARDVSRQPQPWQGAVICDDGGASFAMRQIVASQALRRRLQIAGSWVGICRSA